MKENLRRLRQSRCLPCLAAALSFLAAWTGETGSLVCGGLCILLSLPLLAAPEYLLVPLLSAVLLDNNCNLLPGLTASRYFTMLVLAVEGLNVLLREKPGQWVRRFAYPVLLILYVFVSAVFVGHCFSLQVFTLGMNIALAVLMAALPSQRRERLWRLLPWSGAAAVSYMLFCLNFREVSVISGRYWFLGTTNVNGIGLNLAQAAIVFFAAMAAQPETRKGEWKAVGCFAGYVVSLYLLILTGARSSLLGLVAGCAVLGVLLLLRSKQGRGRRRLTANLAVTCCLSAALCLTAPQLQQRVALWQYDAAHPTPPVEEIQPDQPEAPPEDAPAQPETPGDIPAQPEHPSREATVAQLQENTDSFWRRMNPFDAHWGGSAGRAEIWQILIEHSIKPHPLTGSGLGSAVSVLQANGDQHDGAHNLLIAILSDLGLIGLLLFGVPLVRFLCRLLRRKDPAALLPLGMIVTGLITGVGENVYTERFLWYAAGLALWILGTATTHQDEEKEVTNDESPVCDAVSVQ